MKIWKCSYTGFVREKVLLLSMLSPPLWLLPTFICTVIPMTIRKYMISLTDAEIRVSLSIVCMCEARYFICSSAVLNLLSNV